MPWKNIPRFALAMKAEGMPSPEPPVDLANELPLIYKEQTDAPIGALRLSTNPRKGYLFKYVSGVIPCGQQIGVAYELSQLTRLQSDQNRRFCALPGEGYPFVRQRLGSEANLLNRWPDRGFATLSTL
jgi:hypothetical protein